MLFPTHIREKKHRKVFNASYLLLFVLAFASCATTPKTPVKSVEGTPGVDPAAASQRALVIEVIAKGQPPNQILVNGVPQGTAPRTLLVPSTVNGYFREPFTLKVRLLATNDGERTETYEKVFSPLDRVPAKLVLREGAWEVINEQR